MIHLFEVSYFLTFDTIAELLFPDETVFNYYAQF